MRLRYVNRLTRADVGRRVVVRRWVEDAERGQVQSDVLGELQGWSEAGLLTIRTRTGELVEVDERDVLAAKTVPPAPGRRER